MKSFSQKRLIIATPIIASVILGAVVFCQQSKEYTVEMKKTNSSQEIQSISNTEDQKQLADTLVPQTQQVDSSADTSNDHLETEQTQNTANAIYGVDPDDPSYMKVFDKEAAMRLSGISSDDYVYASFLINKLSSWRYKTDGSQALCGKQIQARLSNDQYSDPIKQLSLCNELAIVRGGWLEFCKLHGYAS